MGLRHIVFGFIIGGKQHSVSSPHLWFRTSSSVSYSNKKKSFLVEIVDEANLWFPFHSSSVLFTVHGFR